MTPERKSRLEDDLFWWRTSDEHYPVEWEEFLAECAETDEEREFLESALEKHFRE